LFLYQDSTTRENAEMSADVHRRNAIRRAVVTGPWQRRCSSIPLPVLSETSSAKDVESYFRAVVRGIVSPPREGFVAFPDPMESIP
jgi:hypothetical protein